MSRRRSIPPPQSPTIPLVPLPATILGAPSVVHSPHLPRLVAGQVRSVRALREDRSAHSYPPIRRLWQARHVAGRFPMAAPLVPGTGVCLPAAALLEAVDNKDSLA